MVYLVLGGRFRFSFVLTFFYHVIQFLHKDLQV